MTPNVISSFSFPANKTNFKSAIGRALIGMRVITKYNNKTYAIDDVNWDLNPEKTFDNKVQNLVTEHALS